MATKNLARTIVEGGRAQHMRYAEKYYTRSERRRTSDFLRRVMYNHDLWDSEPVPIRKHDYKDFADKTAALNRFLRTHCGRPWDQVWSTLCRNHDSRTLKGWHLVRDHAQRLVERADTHRAKHASFVIDAEGNLREGYKGYTRSRWHGTPRPTVGSTEIEAWRAGRRVGLRGNTLFWFVRSGRDPFPDSLRQDRRLTLDELKFWNSLTEYQQHELLRVSPIAYLCHPEPSRRIVEG